MAACSAVSYAAGGPAGASDYPSRPIQVIVPFATGGPTDLISRDIGKTLSEELGQPIVVENKLGAFGTIGPAYVARANPDGYTLLFHEIGATFGIQPVILNNLPYDVKKDFIPIAFAAKGPVFMFVSADRPYKTIGDLIEAAKNAPNKLNFGSAGGAGQLPTHIGPELLMVKTGARFTHVPYKGTGPALVDLAAGRLDFMMTTGTGSARPFLDAKKVRAIGITGKQRSSAYPDIPTFAEQGFDLPELQSGTTWGFFAPAGTPPAIIDKLNAAINKAVADPALKQALTELDVEPQPMSVAEVKRFVAKEIEAWPPLVRTMNIKVD
jgi:tripartite-type tricarboxylate transporter receptor subunit TctC